MSPMLDLVMEGEKEQEKDELDKKNDDNTARASQSTTIAKTGNCCPWKQATWKKLKHM
jgi:hypothetical protein